MGRGSRLVAAAAFAALAALTIGSARAVRLDLPTISPPGDITAAATDPCGQTWCARVSYSFAVTGGTPPYSLNCNLPSGGQFVVGSHTVTCMATDSHGNSTRQASFTVTVTGGGPPPPPPTPPPPLSISPSADIAAVATEPCGQSWCAQVYYSVAVTGGTPPYGVVCNLPSGGLFLVGSSRVDCSASDSHGNSTRTVSFTVTVTGGGAPAPAPPPPPPLSIAPPGDITAAATEPCGQTRCARVSYSFTVTGGTPPYSLDCNLPSGGQFLVGSHTVTCTAADAHGNSTRQASFTVTVTAAAAGPAGTGAASGGSAGSAAGAPSGAGEPAGGETAKPTASASAARPSATDSTAPAVAPHAAIRLAATSAAGAVGRYAVATSSRDASGAAVTLACLPASGSLFRLGPRGSTRTTTVTCTAHDAAGNVAAARSFTVTVVGARSQLAALKRDVGRARGVARPRRAALASALTRAERAAAAGAVAAARADLRAFAAEARRLPRRTAHRATWLAAASRIARVMR